MSQFATMIPLQSVAPNLKTPNAASAEDLQSSLTGEGEGLDFTQTLQDLSASNPYAAALLMALQQAGLQSGEPLPLQTGGSRMPSLIEMAGKVLPQADTRTLQLDSLSTLPSDDALSAMEPIQLQRMLGKGPLANTQQTLTQLVRSAVTSEGVQALESRGLGDVASPLQSFSAQLHSAHTLTGQRPTIILPVQVPVGQPGWDNAVGERIQWMMGRHVQQAEIKLSPPELGPLEIKISLQNDQTNVHFLAHHGATRDALEAAIPRLRELFGDINLNLANVDVNQRQAGDAGTQNGSAGTANGTDKGPGDEGFSQLQDSPDGVVRLQSQGLLDTYV
jgi:flagellar hook-length control protein FliK